MAWLAEEVGATPKKFSASEDDKHTREGLGSDSWWWQQLTNYFGRARTLGLETPGGRQALAKFAVTSIMLLESAARCYGPLPAPGRTSGEIADWQAE